MQKETTVIASGIFVFLSVLRIFFKLSRHWQLRLLGRPLLLDLSVASATLLLHWGTFTGVMAATIAGLLASLSTSLARRVFGYARGGTYYPGLLHIRH